MMLYTGQVRITLTLHFALQHLVSEVGFDADISLTLDHCSGNVTYDTCETCETLHVR